MQRKSKLMVLAAGLALCLPAFGKGAPTPHAPMPDEAVTSVAMPVAIDVLANDTLGSGKAMVSLASQPAHGKARVVGTHVVYQPEAGFEGSDSFEYRIVGSGRPEAARVSVDIGVAFTIEGAVVDAPIPFAEVRATIGGRSYLTTANADGEYRLSLIGTGDDMVVLGARGGADQAAVNFLSILGQFDRLRAEAGDGVLDRTENNQVQVTHVSTAEAFLLQAASPGEIATDAELQAARDALDMGALLQMAAAIKLVVDEGFPLPAGVDDTLEMISNPGAFQQFVAEAEATSPGALEEASQATLADPAVTPPATAADYVGEYTLINEIGAPGTIRVGIGQGERLELAADGTGRYLNTALNGDPSLAWTFSGNEAVAVFNNPVTFTSYPNIQGYGQVRQLVTQNQVSVTRLVDGGGRDIFGVSYQSHVSYPDNPELGEFDTAYSGSMMAIHDGAAGNPFLSTEFPALRTLPVVRPAHINASGYALMDFAADGTGLRDDGVAFGWTLDADGRVLVEYANGSWSRYTRLATDGGKADGVIAVHEWNGMMLAEWSISNVFDGSLSFDAANLADSWRSGFDLSQAAYEPNLLGLYLVLDPDGSAVMASRYAGDPNTYRTHQTWRYNPDAGSMESTLYFNNTGWVPSCTPPVNGCFVAVQRRWHPLAVDGNRIFVIEELAWDADGDLDLDVRHQRGNFYDREAAPFPID
ncbi:MAG TPA: Ig-like domain-containing protein [Xanthomonadaceae bacterium]|nr:Ig-like domain-containing protein [Xanthomonadaceae bacterium]